MKKIMSAALVLIMTLSLVMVGVPAAWADTPTEAGKVFAGYYTDDTYTTPSNGETSYPKFVDEDVLKRGSALAAQFAVDYLNEK